MNALALLTEARDAGVKVTVDGTKIVLEGDGLTDAMVASFREAKPEILKVLTSVPSGSQIGSGTGTTQDTPTDAPVPSAGTTAADALGLLCDDCHRPTAVALVTSYGGRFCRACVFPSAAKAHKAPAVQDAQEELTR
jgi:hypothetical protein